MLIICRIDSRFSCLKLVKDPLDSLNQISKHSNIRFLRGEFIHWNRVSHTDCKVFSIAFDNFWFVESWALRTQYVSIKRLDFRSFNPVSSLSSNQRLWINDSTKSVSIDLADLISLKIISSQFTRRIWISLNYCQFLTNLIWPIYQFQKNL